MSRSANLAKIHIAKKQLGMDDATYRAMLQSHGGVTSSKDLTLISAARCWRIWSAAVSSPRRQTPASGRLQRPTVLRS